MWLHVGGSLDEILHHLVTLLLASGLDLLKLFLRLLVGIVLGFLETARVLKHKPISGSLSNGIRSILQGRASLSASHLGLELLVFVFLLLAVLFDLLLSL